MVYKQLVWQLTASLYDILLLQLLFWINVNSISEVEVDCWLMRWYHSQQVIILLIATTHQTINWTFRQLARAGAGSVFLKIKF